MAPVGPNKEFRGRWGNTDLYKNLRGLDVRPSHVEAVGGEARIFHAEVLGTPLLENPLGFSHGECHSRYPDFTWGSLLHWSKIAR